MLNKTVKVDKIEISGEYCHVQVRTCTIIDEDGVVISRSHKRHVINPGDDYSNEESKVRSVCSLVHTKNIVDSYKELDASAV